MALHAGASTSLLGLIARYSTMAGRLLPWEEEAHLPPGAAGLGGAAGEVVSGAALEKWWRGAAAT